MTDLLQTWIGYRVPPAKPPFGKKTNGLGHLGETGCNYNCLGRKEISAISAL